MATISDNTTKTRPMPPNAWKKGESGNPGGRPKVALNFQMTCRQFMESKGWPHLVTLASEPKHRDFLKALELIAAYAYGKPTQRIESDSADKLAEALQGLAKLALLRSRNGPDPIEGEFKAIREGNGKPS